jgi:importin subunit alpha-1
MADKYIPEHRRTTFKAKSAFKPDELRRRREEQQVEIRRAKREENLAKRRGIAGRDQPGASLGAAPDSDDEGGNIESQVSLPHPRPRPRPHPPGTTPNMRTLSHSMR